VEPRVRVLYNPEPARLGLGELGAAKALELGPAMRRLSELQPGSCPLARMEARCKVEGVDRAMKQLHKLMVVTDEAAPAPEAGGGVSTKSAIVNLLGAHSHAGAAAGPVPCVP
jgi:hypothetical protein